MSHDTGSDDSVKILDGVTDCFIYSPPKSDCNALDLESLDLFKGRHTVYVHDRELMVHKDYTFYCFNMDSPSGYYACPENDEDEIAAFKEDPKKYIDEHLIADTNPGSVVLRYTCRKAYADVAELIPDENGLDESSNSDKYRKVDNMPHVNFSRIGRKLK